MAPDRRTHPLLHLPAQTNPVATLTARVIVMVIQIEINNEIRTKTKTETKTETAWIAPGMVSKGIIPLAQASLAAIPIVVLRLTWEARVAAIRVVTLIAAAEVLVTLADRLEAQPALVDPLPTKMALARVAAPVVGKANKYRSINKRL